MDLAKMQIEIEATDGEALLFRLAEKLEAGKLPDETDIERFADAVYLLEHMIEDDESPEVRRNEFMRKLGMMKPPHREAKTTNRKGALIAKAYWWHRFVDGRENESIAEIMKLHNVSRSTIKRAKDEHPKQCRLVLGDLADLLGIDDERIQRGIKVMQKFERSLRDRGVMPPEYEEWLESKRKRHKEQQKGS